MLLSDSIFRYLSIAGEGRPRGKEPGAQPPRITATEFDAAISKAAKKFHSPEFWRQISAEPIMRGISREQFYLGFSRHVDCDVIQTVKEILKAGRLPQILEVGAGYTVGSGVLHGAPWLSRILSAALPPKAVLVTTLASGLYPLRHGLDLNASFERSQFGLEIRDDVDMFRLKALRSRERRFDLIFGRCLDSTQLEACDITGKCRGLNQAFELLSDQGTILLESVGIRGTEIYRADKARPFFVKHVSSLGRPGSP